MKIHQNIRKTILYRQVYYSISNSTSRLCRLYTSTWSREIHGEQNSQERLARSWRKHIKVQLSCIRPKVNHLVFFGIRLRNKGEVLKRVRCFFHLLKYFPITTLYMGLCFTYFSCRSRRVMGARIGTSTKLAHENSLSVRYLVMSNCASTSSRVCSALPHFATQSQSPSVS